VARRFAQGVAATLVADPAGDADIKAAIEVSGQLRRAASEAVRDAGRQAGAALVEDRVNRACASRWCRNTGRSVCIASSSCCRKASSCRSRGEKSRKKSSPHSPTATAPGCAASAASSASWFVIQLRGMVRMDADGGEQRGITLRERERVPARLQRAAGHDHASHAGITRTLR
jgi:hypothetical protein